MKVRVVTRTLDEYRESLKIYVDGVQEFSAYDGEPEDNSLARNFSDCYSIPDLMKKAYNAGYAAATDPENFDSFEIEKDEGEEED